ncbi:hypothetical protein [Pseudonocardia sp. TMWB2A]|uniref:hypothetical protein n=1 Tax=Pseudonocardia sp. TMWB2A TaxID=687430 RepID=UPI00307EA90A
MFLDPRNSSGRGHRRMLEAYRADLEQQRALFRDVLTDVLDEHGALARDIDPARSTALYGLRATEAALHWFNEITRDRAAQEADPTADSRSSS